MTNDSLPLAELLQKAGDGDFLRAVAEAVLQILPRPALPAAPVETDRSLCDRWRAMWKG
jgi:hypothetical protein